MNFIRVTILAVSCSFCHGLYAADAPDAQYIAELFFEAQRVRSPFPDILRINPDLDEGFLYDVQKRFVALLLDGGSPIGGYKGGFIPKAPIGGVLFAGRILRGSPTIDSRDFHGLMVEAEIAFRLCRPLSTPLADIAALKSATCAVYPAVELPDAALPGLGALREDFSRLRRLLIPTNMVSAYLLLGEGHETTDVDLDRLDVRVELNGDRIGYREGGTSEDDIWEQTLWVINNFVLPNGYTITPNHVIIPGALTGLHPGIPGFYRIDFGALGKIEFNVR